MPPYSTSDYGNAIASIESAGSGGYGALGPMTGGDRAYGRYQVMGANIPEWTKAALGKSLTPDEFLADKSAQDAVFGHRFGSYLEKYGTPQDAASMWFTGRPAAAGAGAQDVLGTTGQGYVDKFMAALGRAPAAASAPSAAAAGGLLGNLPVAPAAEKDTDTSGLFANLATAAMPKPAGLLSPMGFLPNMRRYGRRA